VRVDRGALSVGRTPILRASHAQAPMPCGFPPSNTGNAHEFRREPDRISAVNQKRSLLRLLTRRRAEVGFVSCVFCVTNWKKYPTNFRELANAEPAARLSAYAVVDRQPHTARTTRCTRYSRRNDTGPKSWGAELSSRGELAVAYCCGQTGGNSVIAPEITGHFCAQSLWTAVLGRRDV